jgi:PadR family transcriptional regulator PadR
MLVSGQRGSLAQLRRGALEFCVMAVLADGERYGYELVSLLGDTLGSEGTLYPLLGRLRSDGWVQTTWRESTTGPPRRYYVLTESGRAALAQFRSDWVRFRDAVDDLLDTEVRT